MEQALLDEATTVGITCREFDVPRLMQFMCGFDSLAGEVKGTAVTGTIPTSPIGGEETSFYLYRVESLEDFFKSLDISASVNLQAEFGKGGAKAKFVSSLKVHNYSVYIAAYVKVTCGAKDLQSPKLTDEAYLLMKSNPGTFRKRYGDEFLAGLITGGEFIAFLEIKTSNQTEYEKISASIQGGDLLEQNHGEADFHTFLSHITSTYQYTLLTYQRGGSDQNVQVTPESLINKAAKFPSSVAGDNVYDYEATFQTYDVLDLPPQANPIDIQHQKDVLDQLGLYRIRYLGAIESIQYVLDNPEEFEVFDSGALNQKLLELNGVVDTIAKSASTCFNDYTHCSLPQTGLADPVVNLPKRLTQNDVSTLNVLKKAAADAQSNATACKRHADAVLQIGNTIKPGPHAKALADQAQLECASAKTAMDLTVQSAGPALAIADSNTSPAFAVYINDAEVAVAIAKQAADSASALLDQIHEKGYSPYWKAPTSVLARYTPYDYEHDAYPNWMLRGLVWDQSHLPPSTDPVPIYAFLSDFVEDPMGGIVDAKPSGSVHATQFELDRYTCSYDQEYPYFNKGVICEVLHYANETHFGRYWCLEICGNSTVEEKVWGSAPTFDILLTSRSSGFSSTVTLTLHCVKDESQMIKPYINRELKIVT